jgi:hypothetical protein
MTSSEMRFTSSCKCRAVAANLKAGDRPVTPGAAADVQHWHCHSAAVTVTSQGLRLSGPVRVRDSAGSGPGRRRKQLSVTPHRCSRRIGTGAERRWHSQSTCNSVRVLT